MIQQEIIEIRGCEFRQTTSSEDKYIIQIGSGELFEKALDPVDSLLTYEESDTFIEKVKRVASSRV